MRAWRAWLFGVLAGVAAPPDPPNHPGRFDYTERRATYVVDAGNADDLKRQMAEAMAAHGGQQERAGRTRQHLELSYELEPGPAGCRLARLVLRLDVLIHLPEWRAPETTRPALRRRWAAMLDALGRHEDGHRDIARRVAGELFAELQALPADLPCDELGRRAGRAMFQARLRHATRDRAYEARTRHGVAQGAVL